MQEKGAKVALLGTCDSKLDELLFLRSQILEHGVDVILIDVGRSHTHHKYISISHHTQPDTPRNAWDLPRAEYIKAASQWATDGLHSMLASGAIHGAIAIGGSGGTSLVAPAMRTALPVGFPKLIVSTVASGDTGPIVGESDLTLMYSVVDIAGLNGVLRAVLRNAGAAVAGAARAYRVAKDKEENEGEGEGAVERKKRVGVTMFGVTTPAVDTIRRRLEKAGVEVYVFHATGHGGKAMERLVSEGQLDGVIDATTTELCDLYADGVMSAGADRLEAAARKGIPNIVSLGATDMTNFGARATVPPKYADRKLYEHNPMVTLMRSSKDECGKIGEHVVEKLRMATRPELVQVWIPRGGVSMLSTTGGPFDERETDEVLFETVKAGLKDTGIQIVEDGRDINHGGFAEAMADVLLKMLGL